MQAPAVLAAIPLLAGSALSILRADLIDETFPFICAGAALLALIAATGAALQEDGLDAGILIVLGSLLAGLSLGATAARRAYDPPLLRWFDRAPPGPVMLEGELREDGFETPFGASLTVDVTSVEGLSSRPGRIGGARISVGGVLAGSRVGEWRAGRVVRTATFLRHPSTYLNPGTPDERRPLARRGIVLAGSVKSAALVEVVRHGTIVSETAGAIRAWIRHQVSARLRDPRTAGVTTAVLIGDRSGLSAEDERRLQEAGTYHVIAISGGNIAILAVLILLAARLLVVPAKIAAVLAAILLIFYALIASGAASVARAVTVAVIVFLARALDHRGSPVNALAIAAILASAMSPVVVLDPGFVLSFGATLGILLGVPRLVTPATRSSGLPGRLAAATAALGAATICAEITLAPIGAAYFARVPFAGLVLNFAAIPLMTLVQTGGLLLALTTAWWDAAANAAAGVAHHAALWLLESARLVDVAPWLAADVRPPAAWLAAAYYASALALLAPRTRRAGAAGLLATAAVLLAGPGPAARDRVTAPLLPRRVVVLDVGQGDATVVTLPDGAALLIDAGGLAPFSTSPEAADTPAGFDVGERVVAPALRALGIRRAHGLVLTHGDPDHVLGVPGLLRHVQAASIWEGVPVPPNQLLKSIALLARDRSMTWRTVQAGDAERFGDVEIRVLHPPLPDWERQRVRNEDSVVLELRIGMVSIVLPGDIGKEGERALLRRVEPGRLVVLKAPHHGSATSSTQDLLETLRPVAVIFSCGRDNRFGHPHPAVVERYRAIGAQMFSTAADGAVFVESDGTKVDVRGWTGRYASFSASGRDR
jgi:competence protein ComEC